MQASGVSFVLSCSFEQLLIIIRKKSTFLFYNRKRGLARKIFDYQEYYSISYTYYFIVWY